MQCKMLGLGNLCKMGNLPGAVYHTWNEACDTSSNEFMGPIAQR